MTAARYIGSQRLTAGLEGGHHHSAFLGGQTGTDQQRPIVIVAIGHIALAVLLLIATELGVQHTAVRADDDVELGRRGVFS